MPFREIGNDFSFTLYDRAENLPAREWSAVTGNKTVFLEKDYLQIVQRGEYTKLMCRYVMVYHRRVPCGIIYCQVSDFKAGVFGDLLGHQVESIKSRRLNLFEKYVDSNRDEILLRLFTCGNNLVSGEYGYLFDTKLGQEIAHELLLKIIDLVAREEKLKGTISAILIKDFHQPLEPKELFDEEKYSQFFVEPNLVVNIPQQVHSLNDYIELFSKKYRNRAKSVFKSFSGVETKYLELEEIKAHEEKLYALYSEIFERAKFKLIKLPKDYFSSVKAVFKDKFRVKIFTHEGRIIAFASCFKMPDNSLEAHYIGMDYELNGQYSTYQNILYSMIQEAILHKCDKVNLGRTAAEIKTTVGAKPENLVCYIKPQNTISKLIQKPFISFLQPGDWVPRNPFKEEALEENKTT